MSRVLVVLLCLVALCACGGSTTPIVLATPQPSATPSASSTANSPTNLSNYRFPPGSKVEDITGTLTRYKVKGKTVASVKKYWKSYFKAIGFTKYDKRNSAMFFREGPTRIAVTYVQFDKDVRGTFKVLTR